MKKLVFLTFMIFSLSACGGIDWNESEIKWHGYADGMAAAKAQNKKIILIVYAEWCGVCKKYSKMFKDEKIVSRADNVVFIKIDQDEGDQSLEKYSIDGSYVPRTYLINREQEIMESPYKSKKYQFYLPPNQTNYLASLLDELK